MELAQDCFLHRVVFESNCEKVFKLVNGVLDLPRTYLGNLIEGIRKVKGSSTYCFFFNFVRREGNSEAHFLAQYSLREPNKVRI